MVNREMPVQQSADAVAELDMEVRMGGGMTEDRPIISYQNFLQARKDGQSIRKYALVYRSPTPRGGPGSGGKIVMPAEKDHKWYSQGYRADGYEYPASPPPPQRWLPSMIDDAIAEGTPIPRVMAPPAYTGPVFDTPDNTVEAASAAVPPVDQTADQTADQPELFHCSVTGCARFFDSKQGAAMHERNGHKEPDTVASPVAVGASSAAETDTEVPNDGS